MPESFEGAAVCVDLWSLMAFLSMICGGLKQTRIHSLLLNALFIFAAHQYCAFVHTDCASLMMGIQSNYFRELSVCFLSA